MYRPTWNTIWMQLAESIASRSHSERSKVGTVIVSVDNTSVLAIGYNGIERGGLNVVDCSEPGKEGTIHSEINALLKLNFRDPCKKKLYITLSPCIICSRAIINADIKEVIYKEKYRDTTGLSILKKSGVKVRQWQNISQTKISTKQ